MGAETVTKILQIAVKEPIELNILVLLQDLSGGYCESVLESQKIGTA